MGFCLICEKGNFQEKKIDYIQKVGTHTLQAPIVASVCVHCQNALYPAQELQRANWIMAAHLARTGDIDKESFRYLREVLRLRVKDLGVMLGVTPTTITRWEKGSRTLDKKAATILARMVLNITEEKSERQSNLRFV
jgi:DNA-binding transcriptional regulator YiaG